MVVVNVFILFVKQVSGLRLKVRGMKRDSTKCGKRHQR